jgi:hypothetical protein
MRRAPEGPPNRLARESSPYLLLHAHNPVDWHPWGEEAFDRARAEDKPIFLSVGYSTCYWCHVMERESFSDPAIAAQINAGFVPVKLDREERPDLDEIYMTATQLLAGQGGWPNSVFLTPDLAPFYAGTYYPPVDAPGRPGFPRVLEAVREAWTERRASVLEQAQAVAKAIREQVVEGARPHRPPPETVGAAEPALARRFDPERGGFGLAPKFPSPSNLFFLLDRAREGSTSAERMLVATLDAMARGGIHDQLAGGFHRYSTDASWRVPHFEKMLYDNAALASLYVEAAPLAPQAGFVRVARATLDFLLAELVGPEGGLLSAIDAETEGEEGAYYTWSAEELKRALAPDDHALLATVYGFDAQPDMEGSRHVLHLRQGIAGAAAERGIAVEALLARIEPGRRALLSARSKRSRPLTDDKVLADWNGLAIAALARAGAQLSEPRYLEAASRCAGFVLSRLVDAETGVLQHVYRAGRSKVPALLDDYAFLLHGLLELHAATGAERWLREAERLVAEQDRRLWDAGAGGYFAAGEDPRLLVRPKTAFDGATLSGNGQAALNLHALWLRTGATEFRERCERLVEAFGGAIEEAPLAHLTLLRAVARLEQPASAALPPAPRGLRGEALAVMEATGRLEPGQGPRRRFVLELAIRAGWHVAAQPAGPAWAVPLEVRAQSGRLLEVSYPQGAPLRLVFSEEPLAVYAGQVRVEGELELAEGTAPVVVVAWQACDDVRCLPPVEREIALS